jgi:hypothetical protein
MCGTLRFVVSPIAHDAKDSPCNADLQFTCLETSETFGFESLMAVALKSYIYRRIVRWKATNVSEENIAFIFSVEE